MCRPESGFEERLSSFHRLRRRKDYLLCYRRGSKRRGSALALHFHPNRVGTARLGITASRKVGNAVCRHRLKRWAREIFRRSRHRWEIGSFDVIVHYWPPAGSMAFFELRQELERILALGPGTGNRRSFGNRRRGHS